MKRTPKQRASRGTKEGASTAARYNIHKVAKAAGVSVATVSRALQLPELVAPKTRERVYKAVEELGYTPNAQAQFLRTSRTRVVVAIVPDIANPFFAEVIRGIEHIAHQNRYSVLLGDSQNNPAREQAYADLLAARQADGLITLMPHIPRITSNKASLPIVNACEYVTDESITSVYVDNVAAAREATDYLLTLGHRSIAIVRGPMTSPISVDRDKGYGKALEAAGIRRDPRLRVAGDFSVESGIRALEILFARQVPFTGVFCSSDEMAIGAIRAIKSRGLRVPQDISVVGFDDIGLARHYDPPLTTIAQPKEEMGREAMSMLIEIMTEPNVPPRKRILQTQLVVRGSAARPPTGTT